MSEVPEGEEEFDPHKVREVEAPLSDFRTLLHFLKGGIGTGILAMPLAFAKFGIIPGSIGIVVVGMLTSYGINMLIATQYELCKRKKVGYLSYREGMKFAVQNGPNWMRCAATTAAVLVDVFLIAYQLGCCSIYIVFVSRNVKSVVDDYHKDVLDLRVYMCIFLVLFLLINSVPNLKLFAPLSGIANLLMLTGLAIILYFIFRAELEPYSKRDHIGSIMDLVMFVGISLFALSAVGVVIATEHSMQKPQHFLGVVGIYNISIFITVLLYWFLGLMGYWKYGDCAEGTITLNLPRGDPLSETTQILFAISLVISFGLQCFPAIEILMAYIQPHMSEYSAGTKLLVEYILRWSLVLFTFCIALATGEKLGPAIGLLGAVAISMLGFCFPGIMHISTFWPDKLGRCKWALYKDILVILLGLFVFGVGTYSAVLDFIGSSDDDCKDGPGHDNATYHGF